MPAFAQPCDFLIRYGAECRRYGDPYEGTVTVVDIGDGEAELIGYAPPDRQMPSRGLLYFREVLGVLKELGFETAVIRRIKAGHTTVQRFNTGRKWRPD